MEACGACGFIGDGGVRCGVCGSTVRAGELAGAVRRLSMGSVAGMGVRMRAGICDLLVMVGLRGLLGWALPGDGLESFMGVFPLLSWFNTVWVVFLGCYLFGSCFVFCGTIGHLAVGLQLMSSDGGRAGYRQCLVWSVSSMALGPAAGLAWWPVLLGGNRRGLPERMSGTSVIVRG